MNLTYIRNSTDEPWIEQRKLSDEMALFIFKRLTKSYSDRLWLVIVYDYLFKQDLGEMKKIDKEAQYEYKYTVGTETWPDARAKCMEWGGDLASVHDMDEYDKIKKIVTNSDNFWLGANDLKSEGRWMWSDGGKGTFIRELWGMDQPSGGNTYNCAYTDLSRLYLMNTGCEDSNYSYVCKRRARTILEKQFEDFAEKTGPNGDYGVQCSENCLLKDMKHRK